MQTGSSNVGRKIEREVGRGRYVDVGRKDTRGFTSTETIKAY